MELAHELHRQPKVLRWRLWLTDDPEVPGLSLAEGEHTTRSGQSTFSLLYLGQRVLNIALPQ